jgi:TonB family protein
MALLALLTGAAPASANHPPWCGQDSSCFLLSPPQEQRYRRQLEELAKAMPALQGLKLRWRPRLSSEVYEDHLAGLPALEAMASYAESLAARSPARASVAVHLRVSRPSLSDGDRVLESSAEECLGEGSAVDGRATATLIVGPCDPRPPVRPGAEPGEEGARPTVCCSLVFSVWADGKGTGPPVREIATGIDRKVVRAVLASLLRVRDEIDRERTRATLLWRMLPPAVQKPLSPEGASPPPAGRTGQVVVKVCADAEGRVVPARTKIVNSTDRRLERHALATVRAWRYKPYVIAGEPTPVCTIARLDYPAR